MCAKAVKGPSLARSVLKPLKGPSLARSVPKSLKVPSLARSVPKAFKMVVQILFSTIQFYYAIFLIKPRYPLVSFFFHI